MGVSNPLNCNPHPSQSTECYSRLPEPRNFFAKFASINQSYMIILTYYIVIVCLLIPIITGYKALRDIFSERKGVIFGCSIGGAIALFCLLYFFPPQGNHSFEEGNEVMERYGHVLIPLGDVSLDKTCIVNKTDKTLQLVPHYYRRFPEYSHPSLTPIFIEPHSRIIDIPWPKFLSITNVEYP